MHERSQPAAGRSGRVIGLENAKPGSEGRQHRARPLRRLQQPLELEIPARPAVEKQYGRLGAVTLHMNEVEVLAFHVGREVGQRVEAPFDRTPVVAVPPLTRRSLEVINPDPRRPAARIRQLAPVISARPSL